ncbi:MAG: carboxylating nicotinate-nucleotide diphosphorylase [Candidatus Omnitrophica bacterium]|nr:carboxylating nicotinate-nucleotide diphosphorylase [Candidatus Omnitrophota bacterium]
MVLQRTPYQFILESSRLYPLKRTTGLHSMLQAALKEDIGTGDITSEILVPKDIQGEAVIYAREQGIFCGGPIIRELFKLADPSVRMKCFVGEGKFFSKNQAVIRMKGNIRTILKTERTILNFLGRLSGIATFTYQFVERVKKYNVIILDTRKTLPLWRGLDKYAVRVGGGRNHRMGLYDAIFVKENHRVYGDFDRLRNYRRHFAIEVRNEKELRHALGFEPCIIVFDNYQSRRLNKAVRLARRVSPNVFLEASGGITLENAVRYARSGVNAISIGSLTHSARSINFSLLIS